MIPERYLPIEEIQRNARFVAYKGTLGNKKVFIKTAVDPALKERIAIEASGLRAMKRLDPSEVIYRTSDLVELTDDYIVTSWAEGAPMADHFTNEDGGAIERDIRYLTRLYAFVDSSSEHGPSPQPTIEAAVEKALRILGELHYERTVDTGIVADIAEYLRGNAHRVETRVTNGDLQPGNIMTDDMPDDDSVPTLIDFETYRDSWPRHYVIVNFVFNYGIKYPALQGRLRDMLVEYGRLVNVDPYESRVDFNISAALRTLQIIIEKLSGGEFTEPDRENIERIMRAILDDRLFCGRHL